MDNRRLMAVFLGLLIIMVATVDYYIGTAMGSKAPFITFDGGSKMQAYANVITASDGKKYRVEVTDHFEPDETPFRIVDAYSLDGKYAMITGSNRWIPQGSAWSEFYACSKENLVAKAKCNRNTPETEALLTELTAKTATRNNVLSNFEIYWSWGTETKELIKDIENSR